MSERGDLGEFKDDSKHFDFSAWDSFRKNSFRKTFPVEETSEETPDGEAEGEVGAAAAAAADPRALTDDERRANAAWHVRLVGQSFAPDYLPETWERREMETLAEFLGLQDPNEHPHYLDKLDDPTIRTRKAVGSLFFPNLSEPRSVLLKRGAVLLGSEERELLLFTHGLVVSRLEPDDLVGLLLDAGPALPGDDAVDRWLARFGDLDVDDAGALDRDVVRRFFLRHGRAVNDASLDGIMERFRAPPDGAIALDQFKAVFEEVRCAPGTPAGRSSRSGTLARHSSMPVEPARRSARRSTPLSASFSFGVTLKGEDETPAVRPRRTRFSLGAMLKGGHKKTGTRGRLETAFMMVDVEKIEHLSLCYGRKDAAAADTEWEDATLAIFLKGEEEPVLVTCAKPGHAAAWMEACRAVLGFLRPLFPRDRRPLAPAHAGLIHGLDARKKKCDRISRRDFGSDIDWGDGDETDDEGEDSDAGARVPTWMRKYAGSVPEEC